MELALVGVTRAHHRGEQAPNRVAGKADGDDDQQHLAQRLACDRLQGAALTRRLAADANRHLEREDADHAVDDAPGREPRAREPFERRLTGDPLGFVALALDG